jgi:hypothetical protein
MNDTQSFFQKTFMVEVNVSVPGRVAPPPTRSGRVESVLGTDHALVSQLVSRIEHLSADVSHFDTTRDQFYKTFYGRNLQM